METDFILEVRDLTKKFPLESGFFSKKDRFVFAVNGVSFSMERGKTYGIVGESGSGKSTTAKLLVGMYKKDGGQIIFRPKDSSDKESAVKYIFQDPARSLNPRMSVRSILSDSIRYSKKWRGKEDADEKIKFILEEVGLSASDMEKRPSEFSGGQRQRIAVARGLLSGPELLICDEIVSALDVSIQGQIINLLQDIREKRCLSYLFIAHDLRVCCYFCDRIGVMYQGILVEEACAKDLYKTALHPYTKLLFQGSMVKPAGNGEIKSALKEISGCPFFSRCPHAEKKCAESLPEFKDDGGGHKVRCFCV